MSSYLSLTEIQEEEMLLAIEIDSFCQANDIKYFLASGSILGAVRHRGFIPWDDDMDIYMLRPDYEKFCSSYSSEKYILKYCENGTLHSPFAKLCNPHLLAECEFLDDSDNSMLWVDIFPIDGVPCNILVSKIRFLHIYILMSIIFLNRTDRAYGNPAKKALRKVLHKYFKNKTPEYISGVAKKISNISRRTPVFSTGYLANMTYKRCVYPVDLFRNRKKYKFGNYEFYSFENADKYLKIMFGEYMELPPLSEREGHNMKVYRN